MATWPTRRIWPAHTGRVVALLLLLGGLVGFPPRAVAATDCAAGPPLYAVDSQSGHLSEVVYCPTQRGLLPTEVDMGDWRRYRDVFAVRDGAATVVYALTSDGELWWRRQAATGAQLGVPVRIGAAIDWSLYGSLFVSQPGYIHGIQPDLGIAGGVVRTFRHYDWASGGASVSEDQPLLTGFSGPSITAVWPGGFAETNAGAYHFRIWRLRPGSSDAVTYRSGLLPAGVTGVVGPEQALYGVNSLGHLVRLEQSTKGVLCDRVIDYAWRVTAESGGSYARVVVPEGPSFGVAPPSVGVDPGDSAPDCPRDVGPWEWQ